MPALVQCDLVVRCLAPDLLGLCPLFCVSLLQDPDKLPRGSPVHREHRSSDRFSLKGGESDEMIQVKH